MSADLLGGRLLAEVQEEGLNDVSCQNLSGTSALIFPLHPHFDILLPTDHDIDLE
jgi:hypothetical protein